MRWSITKILPRAQSSGWLDWLLYLPSFVARRSCSYGYTPFSRLVWQKDKLSQTIHYFVPRALVFYWLLLWSAGLSAQAPDRSVDQDQFEEVIEELDYDRLKKGWEEMEPERMPDDDRPWPRDESEGLEDGLQSGPPGGAIPGEGGSGADSGGSDSVSGDESGSQSGGSGSGSSTGSGSASGSGSGSGQGDGSGSGEGSENGDGLGTGTGSGAGSGGNTSTGEGSPDSSSDAAGVSGNFGSASRKAKEGFWSRSGKWVSRNELEESKGAQGNWGQNPKKGSGNSIPEGATSPGGRSEGSSGTGSGPASAAGAGGSSSKSRSSTGSSNQRGMRSSGTASGASKKGAASFKDAIKKLDYSKTKKKLTPRFKKNLDDLFEAEQEAQPSIAGPGVRILIYVALALILLAGLIILLRSIKDKDADIPELEEEENETLEEIDAESGYEKALRERNFRLAIRMRFIKLLQELQAKRLIDWKPDKTNRDYVNELANSDVLPVFRLLSRKYEYVWYGNTGITQEEFLEVDKEFKKFSV